MEAPKSDLEQKETSTVYRFDFNFEKRITRGAKRVFSASELGGDVVEWTDTLLKENGFAHIVDNDEYGGPGYFVGELARNAVEHRGDNNDGQGTVEIGISDGGFSAVVTDLGQGIKDPMKSVELNPDHGLSRLLNYADELTIESLGTKYIKRGNKIVEAGTTEIIIGTKITFIKQLD